MPTIDRRAVAAIMDRDDARADAAERTPLDVDVRTVGTEFRAFNLAAAAGRVQELSEARARVARAVSVALRHDAEPLLALRAYQMRAFVAAVRSWERDGQTNEDLRVLGGDFSDTLQRNRWCVAGTRELLMDDAILRTFFKMRWNDITGLREGPFALSLDEDRLRHAFLLAHPFMREEGTSDRPIDKALYEVRRGEAQLSTIQKLSTIDADYPADLARGVVYYRTARYGLAVQHFRRHLEAHSDGPQTLRAQNYLKAALDRTGEGSL
jgi:hypothetical protein